MIKIRFENEARTVLRTHLSSNDIEHELRRVLDFLAQTSKYISRDVRIPNIKKAGTTNTYGEEQLELDVQTDFKFMGYLSQERSFGIQEFASEEQNQVKKLHTNNGRYSVTSDPLDGSSLVDVNLSIGTIFGIHEGPILSGKPARETMAAAMFMLYGPQTTLIYSGGKGTHQFVLDRAGNWVLKEEDIQMQGRGKIYSPGGNRRDWMEGHKKYIEDLEEEGYKLRYEGSLVGDVHQILLKKGGVFSYPALKGRPEGKLRLLFELQPMAYLMENAGGGATDGLENILDKVPNRLDERSPIYIGSGHEVEAAKEYL